MRVYGEVKGNPIIAPLLLSAILAVLIIALAVLVTIGPGFDHEYQTICTGGVEYFSETMTVKYNPDGTVSVCE